MLFDFDIKYRTGKSNKAVDTLNCCPYEREEMDNDSESEEFEIISYAMVCEEVEEIIIREKLSIECKVASQNKVNKPAQQELELHSSVIEVLSRVSPSERKEAQQAYTTIGQAVQWVKAGISQNCLKLEKKNQRM